MAEGSGYSFEEKLRAFEDVVRADIFEAADCLLESAANGFYLAALRVSSVYLEAVAKYWDGVDRRGGSKKYFVRGCRIVLEHAKRVVVEPTDEQLEDLYELVRCGLYHGALPSLSVAISMHSDLAFGGDGQGRLAIGPKPLLDLMHRQFDSYVEALRDRTNEELRANFERRFDFEAGLSRDEESEEGA